MAWEHIVVATDGGPAGQHALVVVRDLLARNGLRCTVVSVLPPAVPLPASLAGEHPARLEGVPAIEIGRYAETHEADLIVVGRHSPVPGREWPGGTGEALARRSRIPCLMLPEGTAEVTRIVAALDGTPRGQLVLEAALAFGSLLDRPVEAVTVEPRADGRGVRVPRSATLRVVDSLRQRSGGRRESPRLTVRIGDPVEELRREAAAPTDLLVVGARRGGTGVPPEGSTGVGRALLQTLMCAILTVPL